MIQAALRQISLLSDLGDEELDSLQAKLKICRKGAIIVHQGASADALYGVVQGRLKVAIARADGGESILAILGPGEVFGELGLFQDGLRAAGVTTLESTQLVRIERQAMVEALRRSPALGFALCSLLAERVRKLALHLEDVISLTAQQRIARQLAFLARRWGEKGGDGTSIRLALSQTELAELADTTRQTVNKQLRAWKVVSRGGRIHIPDLHVLEA